MNINFYQIFYKKVLTFYLPDAIVVTVDKTSTYRNKASRKDTGEAIGLHASDMVVRLPDSR